MKLDVVMPDVIAVAVKVVAVVLTLTEITAVVATT